MNKKYSMMKKIALFSLLIMILACNQDQKTNTNTNGFNIDVTLDSDINNSVARLFRVDNRKKVVLDSTVITNGKFTFKGSVNTPDKYYIIIDNLLGNFPLIVGNEDFSIEMLSDSLAASKINGSKENEFTKIFIDDSQYIRDYNDDLRSKFKTFQSKGNTEGMTAVRKSYDSLVKVALQYDIDFIKKYPNAALSALTLERITLAKKIPESESKTLHALLADNLKESRAAKDAMAFIEKNKLRTNAVASTAIGNMAPHFSAKTPKGELLSLSDIEAKVIIVNFWASWNEPCRKENPNVVNIYNKYHSKGLEIIGVSLDNPGQQNRWKDAIEKDKLTWKHVSNLKGWNDPIAVKYGVISIPATFILDKGGKIVARNLTGQALENKIAELLN